MINKLPIASSKPIGSIGYKISTILRGETDFYISLSGKTAPKDWDLAAPEALIIGAGGKFTHANGKCLIYNSGNINQVGCLIASHGIKHEEICSLLMNKLEIDLPDYIT